MTDPKNGDEKPETTEAAEQVAETADDAHEATEKPETEVHKAHSETIPEWGQQLRADLDGLIETVNKPVEEGTETAEDPSTVMPEHGEPVGDDTPVRRPWHKRGFMRD